MGAVQDKDQDNHGCCYGFGKRAIPIEAHYLKKYSREWSLYLVSGAQGIRNPSQYFFKFAILPVSFVEIDRIKWEYIGNVSSSSVMKDLDSLLQSYFDGEHGLRGCQRYHIHIALKINCLNI